MEHVKLDDLEIYQLSLSLGDAVWNMVVLWAHFEKRTIGTQLVKAADSISANIAEGYGRFFYKDRKQFCYYSRGSLLETKNWLTKAHSRKLIEPALFEELMDKLSTLHHKLNIYIKKLKEQPN